MGRLDDKSETRQHAPVKVTHGVLGLFLIGKLYEAKPAAAIAAVSIFQVDAYGRAKLLHELFNV